MPEITVVVFYEFVIMFEINLDWILRPKTLDSDDRSNEDYTYDYMNIVYRSF